MGPYYITWLMLSIYRIDRNTSYNILLILIALVFGFEIQVRLKYGTGSYEFFFSIIKAYFPTNFTVGENLKLTRQLFPLLFQFVLIFCDCTIDANPTLSKEEEEE